MCIVYTSVPIGILIEPVEGISYKILCSTSIGKIPNLIALHI